MNVASVVMKFSEIQHFDALKKAGVSEPEAKAILNLVNDANDHHLNDLATKDYVNLRAGDLEKKITELELKMERRFNTLLIAVIVSILMSIALHLLGR